MEAQPQDKTVKIHELKARAYDLIGQLESTRKALNEINMQIADETKKE